MITGRALKYAANVKIFSSQKWNHRVKERNLHVLFEIVTYLANDNNHMAYR